MGEICLHQLTRLHIGAFAKQHRAERRARSGFELGSNVARHQQSFHKPALPFKQVIVKNPEFFQIWRMRHRHVRRAGDAR